ncbi:hypothetical protein [Rhizobium changzhiense]|uniref:Uncharacterized protein n=1 Tax=Rhizobium changzhiense TaxID=2692317 RepID=A0A7Z0UC24_9HYPH|nr:hypothetical protein [Rhizobium changzhiense]MBA5802798.1 hypothetical protein [Rhizobium changzhiense]NZD61993.1 hypothetical protein [Rhizobium changzhiense]
MTIPAMTKDKLRFFFDFGAGGCLWAGDEATQSQLGVGPLDAAVYDLQGHVVVPPRISLPSNVHSLISHLDQEYLGYLNPLYPPDPSLWTQAKCDRFNNDVDQLLVLLQDELGTKFVIVDQQKRHVEDPALGEFLAANPNQKPMP